jgi:hypothetical protein
LATLAFSLGPSGKNLLRGLPAAEPEESSVMVGTDAAATAIPFWNSFLLPYLAQNRLDSSATEFWSCLSNAVNGMLMYNLQFLLHF